MLITSQKQAKKKRTCCIVLIKNGNAITINSPMYDINTALRNTSLLCQLHYEHG